MTQPSDFIDPSQSNHVCLLSKSLYDLKHYSPCVWFQKLSESLLAFIFQASNYDSSLFFLHLNGNIMFLLIYVDDIIVTASNNSLIISYINHLNY
jgi:Reverse transcriptase (RNA-dependent DNA polymerase)